MIEDDCGGRPKITGRGMMENEGREMRRRSIATGGFEGQDKTFVLDTGVH